MRNIRIVFIFLLMAWGTSVAQEISFNALEGLLISPPPTLTQKLVRFYETNETHLLGTVYRHCQSPYNSMDLIIGEQRSYWTTVINLTSPTSLWFDQLVWSSQDNLTITLTQDYTLGNLTYHMRVNDSLIGQIIYFNFNQTVQIWNNQSLICQMTGGIPGLSLSVKCDSTLLDHFLDDWFNVTNLNGMPTLEPLFPLLGTFVLTQSPMAQLPDLCFLVNNYQLAFILVASILGGITLTLLSVVVGLGCYLRQKSRSEKGSPPVPPVTLGERFVVVPPSEPPGVELKPRYTLTL